MEKLPRSARDDSSLQDHTSAYLPAVPAGASAPPPFPPPYPSGSTPIFGAGSFVACSDGGRPPKYST
jgi:hypothetical protein